MKYIIATNGATVIQKNAITSKMKDRGWGFWHHFEEFWMLDSKPGDNLTAQEVCEFLRSDQLVGQGLFMVVIRIPTDGAKPTFYGFGKAEGWEWTKTYWFPVG